MNVTEVAWDKMFAEGSFDLPPTRFIEKVKAAVSEADFQRIKKEILNALKGEKDYLYSCNYSTLTEATNKIYSMLTEILIQEAGQVIDYDIKTIDQERGEIRKKLSQVDYSTNKVNAIKASREGLLRESKAAREDLLKATQDEWKKEATSDPGKDKIRDETAAPIQHLIRNNTLPTPIAGTRKNPDELVIYENEIQTLAQETRDKLTTLDKI